MVSKKEKSTSKQENKSLKEKTAGLKGMICRDKILSAAKSILDKEFPMMKDNMLIHDLLIYAVYHRIGAVQTVENVL